MIWKRLPAFLPNLPLKLLPLSEAQQQIFDKTGFLRDLAFRTTPKTTKGEIKGFLESVYGLKVDSVRTLNVEGKKKRSKQGYHRRSDYKKAYVSLKEPSAGGSS